MSNNNQPTLPDIRKTLVLNASIQKVWNAVATSEGIAAWFMPNDFEPVLGHKFTITSTYAVSPCEVLEIDPPNKLVFSWGEDWVITFALTAVGDRTAFTLTHGGWVDKVAPETGIPYSVARERMNGGWDSAVLPRLKAYIEGLA